MSNAGKIADADRKLASGLYDDDPHRKKAVLANIERWQAEDAGEVPTAESIAPSEEAVRQALPKPSRAAAALLEQRGFTVADMVASEAGATGNKVTVNEVREFLVAQDG